MHVYVFVVCACGVCGLCICVSNFSYLLLGLYCQILYLFMYSFFSVHPTLLSIYYQDLLFHLSQVTLTDQGHFKIIKVSISVLSLN